MSSGEAGRPAESVEGMLAAAVFTIVSLLLVATLPWDRGAATSSRDAGAAPASRSAARP